LIGINEVVDGLDFFNQSISYATLFDKESSKFNNVGYTANSVLPDQERWIVFPYEEWWR